MNNRDDHTNNLSFLLEADGRWQLAPPYDLSYCQAYQGEHFMLVAGKSVAPLRNHVSNAAKSAGLPVAVAAQAIDQMLNNATPRLLLELAKTFPLRPQTVKTVHNAIQINSIAWRTECRQGPVV